MLLRNVMKTNKKTLTLVATMAAFLGCAIGEDDRVSDSAPVAERAAPDFEEVYGDFHVLGYEAPNGVIRVVFDDAESGDEILVAEYDERTDSVPRIQMDDGSRAAALSEFIQSLERNPEVKVGVVELALVVMRAMGESGAGENAETEESFRGYNWGLPCGCYNGVLATYDFYGRCTLSPWGEYC